MVGKKSFDEYLTVRNNLHLKHFSFIGVLIVDLKPINARSTNLYGNVRKAPQK